MNSTIEKSPPPPPRRRRWLQYSLRTLLLVMLAASILLGWFTNRLRTAARQRLAISTLSNLGGVVGFDDDPEEFGGPAPRSYVPAWLRQRLGSDFFHTAVRVVAFNDASMEAVGELPSLTRLDFVGSVSDAGLAPVRKLTRLQRLNLSDSPITDAGLEHLLDLRELRFLNLRGTSVSADGLARLREALPQCQIER